MAGASAYLIHILAGIGAVTLLYNSYSLVRFLIFHLITPSRPLKSYKRAGSEPTYGLITGASAGIGLGIAQALVKQGFAVILLGHLPEELAEAKAILQRIKPGAVVHILVMDVRTATPEEMAAAVQSISNLQISILVNNVGGNPVLPPFRTIATYSSDDVDAVINMNARFMARFTALMLPILTRKPGPKERSLIINLSSGGKMGLPWIVMYGATKAFNWAFSCGLARELEADPATKHVDCLAIIPGDVRTQGNSEGLPNSTPKWDHFGQCIVDKVDNALSRKQRHLIPHMAHGVQNTMLGLLPESTKTTIIIDILAKKKDVFNAGYEKAR